MCQSCLSLQVALIMYYFNLFVNYIDYVVPYYLCDVFILNKHVMLLCAHTAGKLYESGVVWIISQEWSQQVSGTTSVTNTSKDGTLPSRYLQRRVRVDRQLCV
jgi:hypothetical protein